MAGIESPTTGNGLEIGAAFKAARVADFPGEVNGWNSLGAQSGALTGIAANGALFSLRNSSAKLILVRRVGIGLIVTTGFTAAQKTDFALFVARGFTSSDTGGTATSFLGSTGKHRTSLAAPTSIEARIAAAAALTAVARTLDTNAISQMGGWALAATAGAIIPPALANLFSHDTGDYPLVLAQNEGIVITAGTAFGAGGVANIFVNLELAEVDAF